MPHAQTSRLRSDGRREPRLGIVGGSDAVASADLSRGDLSRPDLSRGDELEPLEPLHDFIVRMRYTIAALGVSLRELSATRATAEAGR